MPSDIEQRPLPARPRYSGAVSAGVLVAAILPMVIFVAWVELNPRTLGPLTPEDGPIENATALMFLCGSAGFLIAAARSSYLARKQSIWAYFMIIAWAALAFVCAGEEISWGQRLFGFSTPPSLEVSNSQQEFNFHNLHAFASVGGTYRYLTIFIVMTGLVIPAAATTAWGGRLFDFFAFPVAPWLITPAFICAYFFGKYYIDIAPSALVSPPNAINEVRELMIGYAVAMFGAIGAFCPRSIFSYALAREEPS